MAEAAVIANSHAAAGAAHAAGVQDRSVLGVLPLHNSSHLFCISCRHVVK